MQVIQIDNIGIQSAKAVLAGLLYVLRGAIDGAPSISIHNPALTGKNELIATLWQNLAEQGLIVTEAV
jgi:hypothetical protein